MTAPTAIGHRWQLFLDHPDGGRECVGEIAITAAEMPWLHGDFHAHPSFEPLRPWFEEELALSEREDDAAMDAWEALYTRINKTLSLTSSEGPAAEFLLHIKGDEAWFRWIDREA